MKTVDIHSATLPTCVADAQDHQVLLTEDGRPVAILYGLQDLDDEQLQLCKDAPFWELIQLRRQQPTLTRAELEQSLATPQS
jgi:hypothetical protein